MKNRARTSLTLLSMIPLVSVFISPTTAANIIDEEFYDYGIYSNGWWLPPREKDDASPHYLYLTDCDVNTVKVSSNGRESYAQSSSGKNLTIANGQYVSYVTCRVGTKYSISNGVYEAGYPWAELFFQRDIGWWGFSITGKWSPDSSGRYTYAEKYL